VTTVRPWASVLTAADSATFPLVWTCFSWNAAAALPLAKLTGPENVTEIDRTSDRWADRSLTCTFATVVG
jgi:hypothetical protein